MLFFKTCSKPSRKQPLAIPGISRILFFSDDDRAGQGQKVVPCVVGGDTGVMYEHEDCQLGVVVSRDDAAYGAFITTFHPPSAQLQLYDLAAQWLQQVVFVCSKSAREMNIDWWGMPETCMQ